jgi:hypothetical protein
MTTSRRKFLKSTGIGLALPLLDVFLQRSAHAAEIQTPQRFVAICTSLGLHKPFLHPEQSGSDYELTPYLKIIGDHRNRFTLFDGISHPSQTGADGHSSVATWLTAASNPGLAGFRNTVSIDQLLAERMGLETRYSSLQWSTDGSSQSHTTSGIMLPSDQSPAKVFAKLFLDGTAEERKMQLQRLKEGRSILDMLQSEAKSFQRRVGTRDKEKLDEYYQSIREMERRITAAEAWIHQPKVKVDAKQPSDVSDEKDLIGRIELLFELIPLAIQTDSTRLITVMVQGRNDVPPVPGVSIDHHNLSHHGQDPEKIRQLALVEEAQFRALDKLLVSMKDKTEGESDLLRNTSILFGSNLGNANAHDTKNLPILLAGGRFQHGQHLVLDRDDNVPLCNLFVQIAQQMGQEIDKFGSSNGSSVTGFASVA